MPSRVAIPNLYSALRKLLDKIPRGRVTTYGDLAEALGSISAARWVGEFMAHHDHNKDCGCHRVVRRTGEVGLYVSGDADEKISQLRKERVDVVDGVIDLIDSGFPTSNHADHSDVCFAFRRKFASSWF